VTEPIGPRDFTAVVTFNEEVTGLEAADLSVVGGAVQSVTPRDPMTVGGVQFARNYAVAIRPDATHEGDIVISLAASRVEDPAGNGNRAAGDLSVTTDFAAPVATLSLASGVTEPVTGASFDVDISFSEPVTGLRLPAVDEHFAVTGGRVTAISPAAGTETA